MRTVAIHTWGGGLGTFWQDGAYIGMDWDRLPDWGERAMVGVERSMKWKLGSEAFAARFFETMRSHFPRTGGTRATA